MDQETVGNVVLLAIVTLISVVQNGFFAHKVEHESRTQNGRSFQRTGTLAFERVYTAKWQLAAPSYWVDASGIMNGIYASGMTPELCRCVPHFPCCALDCGATLQPSSRCLCWTDVLVCEAKVLCWLPRRENAEHPWLHIWETHHILPVPHVPRRHIQLLPHLLFRK
ncbi:arachidonate 5-lipoxygenase-activating protein isoform X1 [Sapajus apella]|uniref:Arachidonate 5-lipoxygenase-activating protein isoform X1 n=1 Tax=Sapajus apella TaxID=9515 RepID=A0A6J3J614_SAPAP|nr:arachidonate 5-lipoxygenase-activating protein isoform X1 [Sapajus apella]